MPKVIGVRFRTSPRVYYFAPTEGEEYAKNMPVVVETQRGIELATVIIPSKDVEESELVAPLKPVLRIATQADLDAASADNDQKQNILATAKEKVAARGLEMKIVDCEFTVDHSKLVLYFTAENRVDFRELVRDLASAFHMRIDLRQIGSRDECKLIGSLGCCGMPCCCGRFESDNAHVSIKMAKIQNLALTPNKINGMCGRLLCCLSYENKTYEDIMRRMPKHGTRVACPDGRHGTVVSVTPLTEKVRVRIGDDDTFEFAEFPLDELGLDGAPAKPKPQQPQPQSQSQDVEEREYERPRQDRGTDDDGKRNKSKKRRGKPNKNNGNGNPNKNYNNNNKNNNNSDNGAKPQKHGNNNNNKNADKNNADGGKRKPGERNNPKRNDGNASRANPRGESGDGAGGFRKKGGKPKGGPSPAAPKAE